MPKRQTRKVTRDDRAMPTIGCINLAKTDLEVDFNKLIRVLQMYVDKHFAPVWGVGANLVITNELLPGAWTMAFLDEEANAPGLGYHKLTKCGLPVAKVFVKSSLANGETMSLVASHELAEMLADPWGNRWASDAKGKLYAYEVCDAVEEAKFKIDGLEVSDFVYPAYYEPPRDGKSPQLDHCEKVSQPFEILEGGYAKLIEHHVAIIKHGSGGKKRRFKTEDRRFHRTEYRKSRPERKRKTKK
jgi:hypothetical protein